MVILVEEVVDGEVGVVVGVVEGGEVVVGEAISMEHSKQIKDSSPTLCSVRNFMCRVIFLFFSRGGRGGGYMGQNQSNQYATPPAQQVRPPSL